jgi:hypothetical protein
MKSPVGTMKAAIIVSAVAILCLAGLGSDKATDNAKIYQADLEALKGQEFPKILEKLDAWKFELVDSWMAENPAAKDITKHNRGKVKFSKEELRDVLGQAGKYKFAIYGKIVGVDQASIGTVDQFGMSNSKDATVDLKVYTIVRIVFRDDKLVHVRIWPKLEQSDMSGGTWRIR